MWNPHLIIGTAEFLRGPRFPYRQWENRYDQENDYHPQRCCTRRRHRRAARRRGRHFRRHPRPDRGVRPVRGEESLCGEESVQPVRGEESLCGKEPVQPVRGEKPVQPLCCEEKLKTSIRSVERMIERPPHRGGRFLLYQKYQGHRDRPAASL